ncbi:unnamed protein product [Mesocestoides corti]|nr:unnamed protein product [Mesocestoides corti]
MGQPNYPTGPWDARNEAFRQHFSQLDRMLQSSGASTNRLDSVIALNALAVSAGRRLAGWCCHGAEGDVTVGKDLDEPLIEWRILATLIDYGLDEFEWLEFLSPQQNLIGQALCVLAWPVHGWSSSESASLAAHLSKEPNSLNAFGEGNRRVRRRSSSPLRREGIFLPPPPAVFGAALRRQACLLLINLWSLGAFAFHHIVRRRGDETANNAALSSQDWDPSQRSHSYTAAMEGGDLRRIMLKTISSKPGEMGIEPLGFLRRWSYFQGLWRSALSGTPLPDALPNSSAYSLGSPYLRHYQCQSPQTSRHFRALQPAENAATQSQPSRCLRSYEPVCLRLLTRRAVRHYVARAELARHDTFTAHPQLTVPSLQRFLGYFHNLQHIMGAQLPSGLRTLISILHAEDPANLQVL